MWESFDFFSPYGISRRRHFTWTPTKIIYKCN